MTLKELEPQWLALSDDEKAQVVQLARLYADEQYPYPVVELLRAF